jgi:hypothetical protein
MTSKQESKLSMFLTVKDFLTTNASIVTPLPNYSGFFTAFQNAITQIQTYAEQQMFDKTGLAANKGQLKNTLVMLAADASRKITAYAKYSNNQLLLSETKFTESDLKNATDTELRDNAQGIYDRAQTNLTALTPYGITAATQTTLVNAINAFVISIPKPRIGTTTKKQSTEQLVNAFASANGALNNIDTIIEIIRLTQPNFYSGYKTARKLVETGNGSLAIKGSVIDATNGTPLKGVTLSFKLDESVSDSKPSKNTDPIIKKTAEKGGFNIKSLQAGIYNVTISKNGYKNLVKSIAVSDGELTELNTKLLKN